MSGVTAVLAGSNSPFVFNQIINANTTNYDLVTQLNAAGWNGSDTVIATIQINTNVYVGSTATTTPAMNLTVNRPRQIINIINNGFILGKGGDAGLFGGPALNVLGPVNITNNNVIGGGGGGGGYGCGAGAFDGCSSYSYMYGGGGGGGAGYLPGNGGGISGTRQNTAGMMRGATNGSNGTNTAGGAGGQSDYGFAFGVFPNGYMAGGYGGAGGGLGAAGSGGSDGSWAGETGFAYPIVRNPAAGSGGAAGACTTSGSNARITWVATGTRYGSLL